MTTINNYQKTVTLVILIVLLVTVLLAVRSNSSNLRVTAAQVAVGVLNAFGKEGCRPNELACFRFFTFFLTFINGARACMPHHSRVQWR